MAYERPVALRRCLDSICRLRSRGLTFDAIVVDDGSSVDLEPIVRDAGACVPITLRRIAHRGVSAARNEGLAAATGEFVAFLADDYALPADYLERARDFFAREDDASVLTFNMRSRGGSAARHVQQLYLELTWLQNAQAEPDAHGVYASFRLPASRAAVFRKSVFARVRPFDESLPGGEDGELAGRLATAGIPVHFDPHFYVDHWEEKSLGDYLRQRVQYATDFHAVLVRQSTGRPGRPAWPLRRCVASVFARLTGWARISAGLGWTSRYLLGLPGLMLFLSTFYGTMWVCDRRHVAKIRGPST